MNLFLLLLASTFSLIQTQPTQLAKEHVGSPGGIIAYLDIHSLGNIFQTVMPLLIREKFEEQSLDQSVNYEGFFYYLELENLYFKQIDFKKDIYQAAKLYLDTDKSMIKTHI